MNQFLNNTLSRHKPNASTLEMVKHAASERIKMNINVIKERLRNFAKERDWDQFHSPKNLAMALSVEVSEILEHFQWLTQEQSKNLPSEKLSQVETELADTFIYLIRLADKLEIDLVEAALEKIQANATKYPVDKAKGNSKKYTELDG